MIEVQGISKSFGMVEAVNDVSFKIDKGQVVGFVGPNGAGKTTVMRILTCFLPADSGEATVSDCDVIEDSLKVREKIGYLPESAPLYPDMTVEGFLDYAAGIRGMSGDSKKDSIKKVVKTTSLEGVLKKQINELSKGYRQRVGLAQALVHDPEILILDEPTSGLDPIQIRNFRDLIKELGKDKTIILSTHILSEVEASCETVIMINRGKLVAHGSIDELKSKSKRKNVHHLVVRGEKDKIETALKGIGDIDKYVVADDSDGKIHYEIYPKDEVDISEQIFRAMADANQTVSVLKKEKIDLDSVFAELIAGDAKKRESEEAKGEDDDE